MIATPPKLFSSLVTQGSAPPEAWVLFVHGILGSGANWRTFARQLLARRPRWGAVLVDLRMHGASQGFAPPHTVESASCDLLALEAPGPIRAVVGHSFGGKVALRYLQMRAALGAELEQVWLVDSTPGARPGGLGSEATLGVLSVLEAERGPFATRQAFVDALLAAGLSPSIAQWLAMNVKRDGDAFVFGIDIEAVRALLDDYFAVDLWPVIESPPTRVELVLGGLSSVFDEVDRARAERVAAARPDRVSVVVLPKAGHWVHVDDPVGLLEVVAEGLF